MKILKELIEKADDTLEEIEFYTDQAHLLKTEHKPLADTYIEIADMHVKIYNMLHTRMVALIEEEKKKGVAIPASMQAIWDYKHGELVKEFNHQKFLIDEYKKMSY